MKIQFTIKLRHENCPTSMQAKLGKTETDTSNQKGR